MNFTHLCEYTSSYTPPDPKESLTQNNFINHINSGYSTVFFAGHGNPFKFIKNPSSNVAYANGDANICNNTNATSLIYAFACTTAPIDQNDNNIGEILIKRNNSGAIGYIGGMRTTWYFEHDTKLEKLNRGNAKLFWKEFFGEKKFQQGKALYDSKVAYMNSNYFNNPSVSMRLEYERKNVLTYCLLGDPELDIYTNQPEIIANPFFNEIYEGENVSLTIKNNNGEIIPNARISITSENGLYRTFYADDEGYFNFTIPALRDNAYNISITGHIIKPSYFNFKPLLDTIEPQINNLQMRPNRINETTAIYFKVEAYDAHSGIENIFLLISNDNFENFKFYTMEKHIQGNEGFEFLINSLTPGKYSYLVVARDFANNSGVLFDESFNFIVISGDSKKNNNLSYFYIFSLIIGLTGTFFFIFYRKYWIRIAKKKRTTSNSN